MFCPNCGSNNPDTAATCAQCNTPLNKPAGAGGPKFKGTMLMMNQPGAPLPGTAPGTAPAAPKPPAAGPPSAGAAPPVASKLKGTMVGVAPPVAGAAPAPPASPASVPPPFGAPPSANPAGPDHQTFGSGAGVNPLGGTMVADGPGGGGFGGAFGAPPPPADPFGSPAGAPPPMMSPPPADPFAPAGVGAYGTPPPAQPYGAPPGAPGGADPFGAGQPQMGQPQMGQPQMGQPQMGQGGYGAAPPQDFGGQVQQGFNQVGNAFGQAANEMGNAMGMTPYGAGPGPLAQPGMPGALQPGGVSDKTFNMTLILAIVPSFFGVFGIHRFYTGHIGIGIAQFLTAGGCGIWWLIDVIFIFTGKYRDKQGRPLLKQ